MCGIYAIVTRDVKSSIHDKSDSISNRGPDNKSITQCGTSVILKFYRLAINDLTDNGLQPFSYNDISIICNGEIFNSPKLRAQFNDHEFKSTSDCEILPLLYYKYGFHNLVQLLDGEFSIIAYDNNVNKLWFARDPYGVRPLFIGMNQARTEFQLCSEMKGIDSSFSISQFPPGYIGCIDTTTDVKLSTMYKYYVEPIRNSVQNIPYIRVCELIRQSLHTSVLKRVNNAEQPVGCLLSGGVDSSIICALSSQIMRKQGKRLHTFSIGFEGSPDLAAAKLVAEHIQSEHHEVVITTEDALNVIDDVIYCIESYDTTTVRASVMNYLVAKYIKENTDIKVVLNGDGADEVCGGYLYTQNAPNDNEWEIDCNRLLSNIHFFDGLRSDRAISSKWSLESRTPFLDKDFVNTYITSSIQYRRPSNPKGLTKQLLRDSFLALLPHDILLRPKEAFSDGVSIAVDSWHHILQNYFNRLVQDGTYIQYRLLTTVNPPTTKEECYYRTVFDRWYMHNPGVIPYFWKPKWTKTTDPSAREL